VAPNSDDAPHQVTGARYGTPFKISNRKNEGRRKSEPSAFFFFFFFCPIRFAARIPHDHQSVIRRRTFRGKQLTTHTRSFAQVVFLFLGGGGGGGGGGQMCVEKEERRKLFGFNSSTPFSATAVLPSSALDADCSGAHREKPFQEERHGLPHRASADPVRLLES